MDDTNRPPALSPLNPAPPCTYETLPRQPPSDPLPRFSVPFPGSIRPLPRGGTRVPLLFLVFLDGSSDVPTSKRVERHRNSTQMAPSAARALLQNALHREERRQFACGDGEEVDAPLMDVLEAMEHLSERNVFRKAETKVHVEDGGSARDNVDALEELQEIVQRVDVRRFDAEESQEIRDGDGMTGLQPEHEVWRPAENRAHELFKTPPMEEKGALERSAASFEEGAMASNEGEGDASDGAPASDPGGVFDFSDDEEFSVNYGKEASKLNRTYRRIKSCAKLQQHSGRGTTHSAPSTPIRAPGASGLCVAENKERARFLLTIKSAWQVLDLLHAQAKMLGANGNNEECSQACTEGIRMANHLKRQTLPPEDEIGFTICSLKRLLGELFLMRASCQLKLADKKNEEHEASKKAWRSMPGTWQLPIWFKCATRSPICNAVGNEGETCNARTNMPQERCLYSEEARQLYQKAVEDAAASMTITSQPQAYIVLGDSLVGLNDPAGALMAYIKGLNLIAEDAEDVTQEELYSRLLTSKISRFAFANSSVWDNRAWWPLTMYPEEEVPTRHACDQVLQILQQGVK